MEKADVMSRLTFCGECGYWKPINAKMLKEEYRGYIGYCDKPHVGKMERYKDDFCSRGVKRRNANG